MARFQLLSVLVVAIVIAAVSAVVMAFLTPQPAEPAVPFVKPVFIPAPPAPRPAEPDADAEPTGDQATKPAESAPPAEKPAAHPDESDIRQVSFDGRDIADVLNLWMWKFQFHLPAGQYTTYVWMERWTKGDTTPEVRVLFRDHRQMKGGELLIKLPTANHPQEMVRMGESVSRPTQSEPLKIGEPMRMEVLEKREDLKPNEDVYLVTIGQNGSGEFTPGRSGVEQDNDVTIYVKARFIPGSYTPLVVEGQTIDFF